VISLNFRVPHNCHFAPISAIIIDFIIDLQKDSTQTNAILILKNKSHSYFTPNTLSLCAHPNLHSCSATPGVPKYAFVQFSNSFEAQTAVGLSDSELLGLPLKIVLASSDDIPNLQTSSPGESFNIISL